MVFFAKESVDTTWNSSQELSAPIAALSSIKYEVKEEVTIPVLDNDMLFIDTPQFGDHQSCHTTLDAEDGHGIQCEFR